MEIWLATANKGKILEFQNLLTQIKAEVYTQADVAHFSAPLENGTNFEENARKKAKALRVFKRAQWVIADDSGLMCEGLDGLPGIHSARYAGRKATDSENTAKLLKMLAMRTKNRKAKFVCHIIAIAPDGAEHSFSGEFHGDIAMKMTGDLGFGYDNVFIPTADNNSENKTLAELGLSYKNKSSHRAIALKQLKEMLNC